MVLNGLHAVIEALQHNAQGTVYTHREHKKYKFLVALAKKNNSILELLSLSEIKKRGGRQGVLFEVHSKPDHYVPNLKIWLNERKDSSLGLIIIDHITDPQNLGAIMRSSLLFGIDLMILPEKRVALENEICARSSSGAISILPRYYENNLLNVISLLQEHNVWIMAMDSSGKRIDAFDLPSRCAFILGNEHKGVSKLLLEKSDEVLSIPNNKLLDSFNVSVSAAVACYEYYTQSLRRRE